MDQVLFFPSCGSGTGNRLAAHLPDRQLPFVSVSLDLGVSVGLAWECWTPAVRIGALTFGMGRMYSLRP
jgi:hypothetical protein